MSNRYLFVLHDALGWRTLARRLRTALSEHPHLTWKIVQLKLSPFLWRIMWQPNVAHYGMRHIPLFDSFDLFRTVTAEVARESSKYDAVLAVTQSMAGGLLRNNIKVPIATMIDATRSVIRRDFGATNVSDKRVEAERNVFRAVNHIISLSTWAGDSLTADFGIPRDKITVLPPFAPIGLRRGGREDDNGQGRMNAIFVGGDFRRKGGADLIKWQRNVLQRYINLHIVTQRRFFVENVPGVTWHFDIDNDTLLTQLLPTMDIHCHPTKQDMSAVVITEAAAAGVPSIANSVAGIIDLIDHGVTGFLVPLGDESTFVARVIELFEKRETLNKMSAAAYSKAIREFNQQKSVATILRILEGIAAK